MSQNEYIKYKKTATELKINKLPNTFDYETYNSYKAYSLENSVSNTKTQYNQLIPSGRTLVWNMEKKVTNCPKICNDTQSRTNKKTYPENYNANYCATKPSRPLSMKKIDLLTKNSNCKCLPL